MLSIQLGPFALPVAPLLVLAAIWIAYLLAVRLAAKEAGIAIAESAGQSIFSAAVFGLVAARIAHVARFADAYFASPWSLIDLRDGGWNLSAGLVAGAAWMAWRAARSPELRRPLAVGGAVGLACWLAASTIVNGFSARSMPSQPLAALDDHATITLAQAANGRPVVVNLWASWCGPCRQEMPVLAAAQQRETHVGILFVNQGETESEVRAYLGETGLQLREVLLDAGSTLLPAVGSRGLPTTLFYDAQGRLVDAHFGVLNPAALESRLRELRTEG